MRIYEYSKEHDIPAKDLVEILKNGGFLGKTHMSALTDEEVNFLDKIRVPQKPLAEQPQKLAEKKSVKLESKPQEAEKKSSVTTSSEQKVQEKQPMRNPQKNAQKSTSKEAPTVKKETVETLVEPVGQDLEIVARQASVSDIAADLKKPVNEIILTLLKWGIVTNKNQVISEENVERLAEHYLVKTRKPAVKKEEVSVGRDTLIKGKQLEERPPVVVVVGHVDHGKTTLLDYIRKTRVASREKGGITQHLGAYEARIPQGKIVFIDTPGHEAFSKIRQRGLKVADIAILVIAADDGIMPQTIEAIKFAKSIEVPIIVAINKVDKVDAVRLEVVRRQLAQQDLLPEDWGGHIVCVPISAKLGTGIDHLLEMIILQAQMMELKGETSGPAAGYVLESKVEKGFGAVATILIHHGKAQIGDSFICGATGGRISSMVDSYGKRLKEVGPAVPVQIAGLDDMPNAGDFFEITSKEAYRKAASEVEQQVKVPQQMIAKEGSIPLIVKTDTNSSQEALVDSINKLSKKLDKGFGIITSGLGAVTESDVQLAANTGAHIIALHVKSLPDALILAQRTKVKIHSFYIIYKLLEFLEAMVEGKKPVVMVRKKTGDALVLKVFDIKGVGVIAGCRVVEGRFPRDGFVIISRRNKKIGEGFIKSLQRDKKTVKEVHTGFECGFLVDGFVDFAEGDTVECFIESAE